MFGGQSGAQGAPMDVDHISLGPGGAQIGTSVKQVAFGKLGTLEIATLLETEATNKNL